MNRIFINKHLTTLSILLFIVVFGLIQYVKPALIYNKDGSLRNFGLRKSRSSVAPLWIITTAIALLSYSFVFFIGNNT